LILLYIALGVAMFVVLWKRRVIFRSRLAGKPGEVVESLPRGSWRVLQVSFALSWGFLVLLLVFPVSVASTVGAPAILLFAVASWILFGSMVTTYWPLANGYPTLTLPLILAALMMSWWNDNHTIRTTEARIAAPPREAPEEHFRGWLEARLERAPAGPPYPVFVVAAAVMWVLSIYDAVLVSGFLRVIRSD